jgi:anti-sigma B factor antagonist
MATTARIHVADSGDVRVIRFLDRRLFDDPTVREAAEQVFAALPADGPIRLVLDFSAVEQVSSAMLGKLILLQRRTDTSRGMLRLCELNPTIQAVLRTTNLDRLFGIDRDVREAREVIERAAKS